jgi:hypothetical protein
MTKEKAKRKCTADDHGRFAISTMSAEGENWVSGYIRHCCTIYIFHAVISKEDSLSCIDCKRIERLRIILVEESGDPLVQEKQRTAAEFDKGWKTRAKIDNDPMVCANILDCLERRIETGLYD